MIEKENQPRFNNPNEVDIFIKFIAQKGFGVEGCFGCYDIYEKENIIGQTMPIGSDIFPKYCLETTNERLQEIAIEYLLQQSR